MSRPTRRPRETRPLNQDEAIESLGSVVFNLNTNQISSILVNTIPLSESPMGLAYTLPIVPQLSDFTLVLPSTRYEEYPPDRMVYHSDRGFTPYDILGAIYTYYHMPLPRETLERMVRDEVANADLALEQANPTRIDIMGDLVTFEGIAPLSNGENIYEVALASI